MTPCRVLKTPTQRGWQWNVMDISWLPTADVWLGKLWYYLTLLISHSSFCLLSYTLGEGCSHIAAIIFKIESAVRNGHTCCTSSLCHWNQLLQVKALHTIRTLSMFAKSASPLCFSKLTGRGPWRIVYRFFSKPMIRSTWMWTADTCCEVSTSFWESCFFPRVNAGISNLAPWIAKSSSTMKPWSAGLRPLVLVTLKIHTAVLNSCQTHVCPNIVIESW